VTTCYSQVILKDTDTKEPISYATYYSTDKSCVNYSDNLGKIHDCLSFDSIHIVHLSYNDNTILLHENYPTDTTIYLTPRAINIDPILISAERIDIYKEITLLLKRFHKKQSSYYTNNLVAIYNSKNDKLIESSKFYSLDFINKKGKIKQKTRNFGVSKIHKDVPFLTLNMEVYIKAINSKTQNRYGISHLMNTRRITKDDFNLEVIRYDGETKSVRYSNPINGTEGIISYNPKSKKIIEHQCTVSAVNNSLISSLNLLSTVVLDTVSFVTKFNDRGKIKFIAFNLCLDVKNSLHDHLKTSGYISYLVDREKKYHKLIYPLDWSYGSIHEELMFSPINIKDSIWLHQASLDKGYQMNKFNQDFVETNQKASHDILEQFDALRSNNIIWSKNRLDNKAYALGQLESDYNNNLPFIIDQYQYKVYWVFNESINNTLAKYISLPSVWNVNSAKLLVSHTEDLFLISNVVFDIFEVNRRKCLQYLNANKIPFDQAEEKIIEFYKNADSEALSFIGGLNIKNHTSDEYINKLGHINENIKSHLGVDNLDILESMKGAIKLQENKYSPADVLFLYGYLKEAKERYQKDLQLLNADDEERRKNILHNLNILSTLKETQGN